MRAMILAAGLGTRLKPFTDKHPKALAQVNGKSLLRHNIEFLVAGGVTEIIVNVHHFADQVNQHLLDIHIKGVEIFVSDETAQVLETGGGLMKASWFLEHSDPFILMNVDVLTDLNIRSMLSFHLSKRKLATLAVSDRVTSRYFLFDERDKLCGWTNIKTGEERLSRDIITYYAKAFSGVHVLSPQIFPLITQTGKFSMVDVYLELARNNDIFGYDHTGCRFIDVGTEQSIKEAENMFP